MSRKAVVLRKQVKSGLFLSIEDNTDSCLSFLTKQDALVCSRTASLVVHTKSRRPPVSSKSEEANESGQTAELRPGEPAKGKWAAVADRISREGFLTGLSEHIQESSKEFRDSFMFRDE
ncbi:MAG: hypothetical protein ACLGSA_06560 [Acidobacteriota bacterium]